MQCSARGKVKKKKEFSVQTHRVNSMNSCIAIRSKQISVRKKEMDKLFDVVIPSLELFSLKNFVFALKEILSCAFFYFLFALLFFGG